MYWFLAIVKKEDVEKGNWIPFYTLCRSHGTAETRSPWRVTKRGMGMDNMPKVLVNTVHGNDKMIEFMSCYRTRDHMHKSKHKSTKKYYPEGTLCWFPCDHYGDQIGPALIIKKVPDKMPAFTDADRGLVIYKESLKTERPCSYLFSNEPGYEDIYMKKPVLAQPVKYFHFYRRQSNAG